MKILTYSDLHLEFAHGWLPQTELLGDVLVLAGDIISFIDPAPLTPLLDSWGNRPVIFIAGNHEFYNAPSMKIGIETFQTWLRRYPNVHFLQDEAISIGGINFFGGTMWTDFAAGNHAAMSYAKERMNDFKLIYAEKDEILTPEASITLHQHFLDKLSSWLQLKLSGSRVVVSHHAPILKHGSGYIGSPLIPAFNSLDMTGLIERYQPDLWIYGHTHECDRHKIGKTEILSNQLGYRNGLGGFECLDFDKLGLPTEIS